MNAVNREQWSSMAGQESPAATTATAATLLLLASLTHPISAQFSGLTGQNNNSFIHSVIHTHHWSHWSHTSFVGIKIIQMSKKI